MIATMQGPSLFIAQYVDLDPALSSLEGIAGWAAGLGFRALQIPTFFPHILDLERAAAEQDYCDGALDLLSRHGLALSELASPRQGQLMAIHPAYHRTNAVLAPAALRDDPDRLSGWAARQLDLSIRAARRLGVDRVTTFSGSLLWPYFYPYPPVPQELITAGFAELARRWRPILDLADSQGVDICFELHPTSDLHDGSTFERFFELVGNHPRACLLYDPSHMLLQHVDYLGFIALYADRIRAFHVKDAEFRMSPRTGVYGGYDGWLDRAGRFRSPGDGQIDFKSVFSSLTQSGYRGWATLEWECCLKNAYDGAREGRAFIDAMLIEVPKRAFDAPIKTALAQDDIEDILGLQRPLR